MTNTERIAVIVAVAIAAAILGVLIAWSFTSAEQCGCAPTPEPTATVQADDAHVAELADYVRRQMKQVTA